MPVSPGTHVIYTVMPGDTLYKIANQFGASVEAITQANAIYPPFTDPGLIYPGQKLLVRLPGMSEQSAVLYQVTSGDTLYRIADTYSVGLDMLAALNQIEQPDILRVAQLIYIPAFVYTVESGDSMFKISRRFGLSMTELMKANRGRPFLGTDVIYPGYSLVIPFPSSTNIVVLEPMPGAKISSGQTLFGYARAFEANVLYMIFDTAGVEVSSEKAITASEGAPGFGQFSTSIQFNRQPTTSSGAILVYTRSAKDGSIQDLVEVPVTF